MAGVFLLTLKENELEMIPRDDFDCEGMITSRTLLDETDYHASATVFNYRACEDRYRKSRKKEANDIPMKKV